MKRFLHLLVFLLAFSVSSFAQTTRTIGSGSPEGVVTAGVGSVYQRTDCSTAATCFYIKTSGAGNTGWSAVDPTASGGGITALTGDVTATGPGSAAATIANGAVTNAKLANPSISIAGTSTSLGGSITLDAITGLSSTGLVKRSASNTFAIAASGTDYAPATSGTSILYGNNAGGFSNVVIGSGLNFSSGTLSATGGGGGSGDVVGPSSATDNAIARFDSTTGKLIQNSVVTIADTTGNMAGVGTLNSHTIPGGTDTFAMLGVAQTFTANQTFGSGILRATSPRVTTSILDANGNTLVGATATSSAVNYVTIANAATGTPPRIEAVGSDTDIGLYLKVKNGDADTTSGQIYGDPMVRYDYPTYSFYHASNAFRAYGMGLNAGGAWLSLTGPNISLQAGDGAAGIVALQGLSILAFSENNSTGIDCPQCQVVGIKKGSRHSIAVVGSDLPADGDFPNGATLNFPASAPSQITASQNNYNPGTFSYAQYWSSDASRNVTGLLTSSTQNSVTVSQVDGQVHRIYNSGSNNIVLKHQDTGSDAANRFLSSTGADVTLVANECADVQYQAGSVNRWRVTPCASAGGGSGTVTTVSVASANGFAGSVANATTTPAITLTTSITGVLKGNGTAISAASSGTDYVAPGAVTSSGLTMATARLLGRSTASTGAIEEITVGSGLSLSGGTLSASGGGGSGDVVGPSSSVDNELPRFDSTTGKLIQASGVTLSDLASNTYTVTASSPTQGASATVGSGFNITASPAIAGNTNAGAAAGGAITLTAGAAARLTSGNANGGNISFTPGAGIGTGTTGAVVITTGNLNFGGTASSNIMFKPNGTGGAFRRGDDSNLSGDIFGGSFAAGTTGAVKALIDAGNTIVGGGISSDATFYLSSSTNVASGLGDLAFLRDSTNTMRISRGTSSGIGNLLHGRAITAKTADYTVVANDSNRLFTNAGASGAVNFTLPTAAAGLTYTFYIDASQTLTITAGASTTIRSGGSVTASAGNITASTVGNTVRLTAISATQWIAETITGTWTFN